MARFWLLCTIFVCACWGVLVLGEQLTEFDEEQIRLKVQRTKAPTKFPTKRAKATKSPSEATKSPSVPDATNAPVTFAPTPQCSIPTQCPTNFCSQGFCTSCSISDCGTGFMCSDQKNCVALLADGISCTKDGQCDSGTCDSGVCFRGCKAADESCSESKACCGLGCLTSAIGGLTCQKLSSGNSCSGNENCLSNVCFNGVCTCCGPDAACRTHDDCCSNYGCSTDGVCARLALGASCTRYDQCSTNICTNNICTCKAVGESIDGPWYQCCTGWATNNVCDWLPLGFTGGLGMPCRINTDCQTKNCASGACAKP